jgi:hypothetical protein
MSEIVLLYGHHRYFRAAVLKNRGYHVFTTEHVVEVCLRWARGGCAALVIGPEVQWKDVATLCDWIKINSPEKPVMVLSDHRNGKWPARIEVVPTQPVQALAERLDAVLPQACKQNRRVEMAAIRTRDALGTSSRVRNS